MQATWLAGVYRGGTVRNALGLTTRVIAADGAITRIGYDSRHRVERQLTVDAAGAALRERCVLADGTRTTMIIPAGAMGNVAPIEVVSERWFSQELQTAVMIVQRDPRSGETVYRLTNISRAEPPPDLFVVPPDYKLNR